MSNEETMATQVLEEEPVAACEPTSENEEVVPTCEEAVEECNAVVECAEDVAVIQRHNDAVAYLRKQDCAMLTTLRDHLKENIRLNKILADIQAEIASLKKLLKTPKPKFKILLVIIGVIMGVGGMLLSSDKLPAVFYASLGIGVALIILAIVLKILGNKKWQAFIDETNAKIREKQECGRKAQQDIDEYWDNHALPYINSIIPDRFPAAHVIEYNTVCGMLHLMENLRADTIKEAINLYDEICFRNAVKGSAKNMESSLYETARNAARSAAAAERSAAANESAAASAALTAASAASMAVSAARAADASVKASNASEEASRAVRDRMRSDY